MAIARITVNSTTIVGKACIAQFLKRDQPCRKGRISVVPGNGARYEYQYGSDKGHGEVEVGEDRRGCGVGQDHEGVAEGES